MQHQQALNTSIIGHVSITDDLGNTLLDQFNAIHPQNMARVIARALANEENSNIFRIAFGNGGTQTTAASTITFETPNTGQEANINQTFDSRLHRETYSEIVDDTSASVGIDPGSADATGVRPGGGSIPGNDTSPNNVSSLEVGFTSNVTITATLNTSEPGGQVSNDTNTQGSFVFDELGLYTAGAPAVASTGTQDIDVSVKNSQDNSGLQPDTTYQFEITVDGGASSTVIFTVPATGGTGPNNVVTYGDLCEALNTGDSDWGLVGSSAIPGATILISDDSSGTYPSIAGANTNGFLRFASDTTGSSSSVSIEASATNSIFLALNAAPGIATIGQQIMGQEQGVQNNPSDPSSEQERLLTHLIFAPVLKSPNRTLTIVYTLSIAVTPTIV